MQDLFITKIHISKVRHLENIDIQLSENEKKHLILTGKNGSGKTSILNALSKRVAPEKYYKSRGDGPIDVIFTDSNYKDIVAFYSVSNSSNGYVEAADVIVSIPAGRTLNLDLPRTIEAVDISTPLKSDEIASKRFIKYMLHLNYQRMSAITNDEPLEAEKVEKWFSRFTAALQDIYDCPELKLTHDSKDLSFKIIMPDREPFGLNEMADGYSSFLNIVMELMMRMENKASLTYELPGIILIDEIETHLHVELQKRVLPFLTKMFPRIQFIVTTHSPFVITSISDAVVFDLEKQKH